MEEVLERMVMKRSVHLWAFVCVFFILVLQENIRVTTSIIEHLPITKQENNYIATLWPNN
jgi:hypothetical protein